MENESNKQTAVEWYSNKLLEILGESVNNFTTEQTMANHYALKQAKAMEKEQIENAYLTCHKEYTAYGKHWEMGMDEKETFEEYFEQKYGKTFLDLVSDEESKVHEVVRKLKEKKN